MTLCIFDECFPPSTLNIMMRGGKDGNFGPRNCALNGPFTRFGLYRQTSAPHRPHNGGRVSKYDMTQWHGGGHNFKQKAANA